VISGPDPEPGLAGPVLEASASGRAVARAIRALNPAAQVLDRGAYLRVQAPGACRVTREEIERALGEPFHLPADLEKVMPSFQGRLQVTRDEARWEAGRR
jgi:toluene monooxygenase system protein D